MTQEDFNNEMDQQAPNWYIDLANELELRDLVRHIKNQPSEIHLDKLRSRVGNRLFICARAVHNGLIKTGEIT